MTLIIGYKGCIYGDRMSSWDWVVYRENVKVVKWKNFLLGAAGDWAMCDLLMKMAKDYKFKKIEDCIELKLDVIQEAKRIGCWREDAHIETIIYYGGIYSLSALNYLEKKDIAICWSLSAMSEMMLYDFLKNDKITIPEAFELVNRYMPNLVSKEFDVVS